MRKAVRGGLKQRGPRHGLGLLILGWMVAMLSTVCGHAVAEDAGAGLDDHVYRLASELRCMVCENQSVADSQSPLALQLRTEIRRQLSQGVRDEAIREFMIQRFGASISYRPPARGASAVLWWAPWAMLLAVAVVVGRRYARTSGSRSPLAAHAGSAAEPQQQEHQR